MNPRTILSSEKNLKRIESVCKRHFSDENEANECYLFIIDNLTRSDYQRLRAYKGNSSLDTYLYALCNSLVIDFRRKRYGRRRIPAKVSKLGAWAEAVYRLVCWQKFSFDDTYDLLCVRGIFKGTFEEFLRQSDPVRDAPCPENPAFLSADDKYLGDSFSDPNDNPLEALIRKLDREKRIRASGIIRKVTMELSEEEQLLIRLVYGSDCSAAGASRVIGIKPHQARRRLKSLLLRYQEALLAEGIRKS